MANKELKSFAYSVSHDLRVPLRAIDGFSQILVDGYQDKLDAEGRRIVQVVRDGATRMGRLIDDILAFSRIGRQAIAVSETDMAALVDDALRELAPFMAGRAIEMKIEPLPHVRGDPVMLQRVWTNLLANAIKFTRSKPHAVIEVGVRADGGETVFFVKDNGAGYLLNPAGARTRHVGSHVWRGRHRCRVALRCRRRTGHWRTDRRPTWIEIRR